MNNPQERAEYEQAVADAWTTTSSAPIAASALRDLLLDAEQAGRAWARQKLDEAEHIGLMALAKRHRRISGTTRRGSVALVAGVADGAGMVQLELVLLTPGQLRHSISIHDSNRKAAVRNLTLLNRLLAICDAHPKAATVGDALIAAGTSLDEVLAA